MSDNRRVAVDLLKEGAETIAVKRPGVHGSAENSFEMIGDMWGVYLRHARRVRGHDRILPEDVAEMMALLKKARKIYGDAANRDNDVDDVGYTALAGMLRLPDPYKAQEDQIGAALKDNLDDVDPTTNGHEHVFGGDVDDDGFAACVVEGCSAKQQTRKPKNSKKEQADASI